MPQILLTGATGFLGQHILRELIGQGYAVSALARSSEAEALLASQGAQAIIAELNDADSLLRACEGIETIFHTAADTNMWRPNNAQQTRTNVEGMHALLAAAKHQNVKSFLHTSSTSTYSHLMHETLHEASAQRGGESWINYERTKFLAEQAVRHGDIPYIIFNPAHIFGPGDKHNWSRLIGLIDKNGLPGIPPGSGSFADAREIAKAQVRALQRQTFGQSYLLGGEHASFLQLVHMIGEKLGRKTPNKAIPAFVLRLFAQYKYGISLITRRAPDITPESAALTIHDLKIDSSKAMRDLDYKITDLSSLLDDTIAWLRSQKMIQ
jgi:dihydroflavonol-4-reductase